MPATQPPSHPASKPARRCQLDRRAGIDEPACQCRLVDASQPPPASFLSGAACKPKAPSLLFSPQGLCRACQRHCSNFNLSQSYRAKNKSSGLSSVPEGETAPFFYAEAREENSLSSDCGMSPARSLCVRRGLLLCRLRVRMSLCACMHARMRAGESAGRKVGTSARVQEPVWIALVLPVPLALG